MSDFRRSGPVAAILCAGLALAGCSAPDPATGFSDPLEPVNRRVHAFNKGVDRVVYDPASTVYGVVVPGVVRDGVNNFSRNLGAPQNIVNSLLQGDINNTLVYTLRFAVNTTYGVLGIFDFASAVGVEPGSDTDFGETLHVWGVGEGVYLAVPFLGPSTARDTAGDVVDFLTDPFAPIVGTGIEGGFPPGVSTGAWVLENADYRYEFSDSIENVLYDSADSYAQSRLIYLENRRFELGSDGDTPYVDPYDDLFAE